MSERTEGAPSERDHQVCTDLCVPGIGFHVRTTVIWWAKQTEMVLKDNDHKGGWLGPNFTIRDAIKRLREEVLELEAATSGDYDSYTVADVVREAADVSNFAMMIADRARRGFP